MDGVGDLLEAIGPAVDQKFPRIKLKFRPGWDVDMLMTVRQQFPVQTFHIDCNSGYRLSDLPMFRRIDEFRLAMIEQPLAHDDLYDHARLQAAISTPVCLDESVAHPRHAEQAVAAQGVHRLREHQTGPDRRTDERKTVFTTTMPQRRHSLLRSVGLS